MVAAGTTPSAPGTSAAGGPEAAPEAAPEADPEAVPGAAPGANPAVDVEREAGRVVDAVAADTDVALVAPVRAERAGGGYSWRTWVLVDATDRRVVVRVAPPGGTMSPYDPAVEARAIAAAGGSVPAPDVLAVVATPNGLDAAYGVHTFASGEVQRLSAVGQADRPARRASFATTLGRLHAMADPAVFDPEAAAGTVTDAYRRDLAATAAAFARSAPHRHPGFTIGLRWLHTHLPRVDEPPRLCHGDFRFHNLAWTGSDVAAVLDWERAWVGDPMVDVAFTRRFSGWCAVDGDAVGDWEAAAGRAVDEDRVAYGARYEWVRSYTSSSRGWHALAAGRDDALDLYAIGEAGWAGAWALVDLLAEGPLEPAPADDLAVRPGRVFPPARRGRLADLARSSGDQALADHLARHDADDASATSDSVAALRATLDAPDAPAGLAAALDVRDDAEAWAQAHGVLAAAALTGGPELVTPLQALGRRFTTRDTLLPFAPGADSSAPVTRRTP